MSSTSISDAMTRIESALWYGDRNINIMDVAVNVCLVSSEYYVSDHEEAVIREYIKLCMEVSDA